MAKRKPVKRERQVSDLGPVESQRHKVVDTSAAFPRLRSQCECRVDYYLLQGFLNDRQHETGIRFRALYQKAIPLQRITSRYSDLPGGGVTLQNGIDRRIDANRELKQILGPMVSADGERLIERPVLGVFEAHQVENVCGNDEYAGRGGMRWLQSGLDKLSRYWGIK